MSLMRWSSCQATRRKRVDAGSAPVRISHMTPKDYILSTLETLKAPIQMENIGNASLEDAIYSKVMSKKFRKVKPGDSAVKLTRQAISLLVKEKKPIRIFEMFGGNKLWRFDEAPEIDWAELFSFTYFSRWARHIASVYEPGVIFEYFSQDISVERLNNVPRSKTDKYSKTFISMLDFVKQYLPGNISFIYTRHHDLFENPNDYYKEIKEAKQQLLRQNNGKFPEMTDAMKAATELNVKLNPGQDKDPLWREKVEWEHQAIFITRTLKKVDDDPKKIWTCPTYYPDSVVTGSTKRSFAKFWAAVGVLEPKNDSFAELVLTPRQLESAKFDWYDVDIKGLEGKNFKRVRVLKKT
jgi:hypothetical protein